MKRIVAALALLALSAGVAPGQGLDIKGFRPAYGVHGATRVEAAALGTQKSLKLVQGDVLYAEFTITGLTADAKGRVNYETTVEFSDKKNKRHERKTPNLALPELGGGQMPGEVLITIGDAYPVGSYTLTLTIDDKIAKKKITKPFAVEVMKTRFAFVHVESPALGLPGERTVTSCLVTGFKLDGKKEPNVEVAVRVLDANGKALSTPPPFLFPRDLPPGVAGVQNAPGLPVVYPLTPNRPGLFFIELVAIDRNAKNAKIELQLPLRILDIGTVTSGK